MRLINLMRPTSTVLRRFPLPPPSLFLHRGPHPKLKGPSLRLGFRCVTGFMVRHLTESPHAVFGVSGTVCRSRHISNREKGREPVSVDEMRRTGQADSHGGG